MVIAEQDGAEGTRRAGQREAQFERLARRFHADIYTYLRRISRDPELAEDLTQETFVQVWRHLEEVREERARRAWVYRIARNAYLIRLRRTEPATVPLDEGELDATDFGTPGPEVRLEQTALCQAVRAAVERLPEAYREVIVLHNWQELSLSEVASVLQLPIGTVKSRRARALAKLRELLQELPR